jgi:thioredoxin-related protein
LISFIVKFVEQVQSELPYMKKIFLSLMAGAVLMLATAMKVENHKPDEVEVNWITFEQAIEKSKTEKRKIFIDVYTDWCGWCKVMDKNTFNDPAVAKMLNDKFYAIKFNAEQREDVVFQGTTFKFIENGRSGYHQLAAALMNNQMSYPTVVFLDEEFKMIQPLPGYRKAPEFHMIAQFIGNNHYKTEKWDEWQTKYKSPYGEDGKPNN